MTTTSPTSASDSDEQNHYGKQEEMIRQYLQIANVSMEDDSSTPFLTSANNTMRPLTINSEELRKDLQLAEERVNRLRQELKELQKKRENSFLQSSPPPYISPTVQNITTELLQRITERSSSPLVQDFYLFQSPNLRGIVNGITAPISSPSLLLSNLTRLGRIPTTPVDLVKDQRNRQFQVHMQQHREQLLVYLDSLKQALSSLDRLASLEPIQSEIHLESIKLDTIQQKSRQLRALKSTRSAQQSPFIECRIRQLERDLVHMLAEHQKDVQRKLELNEQRSLMLLKIMQVNSELSSLDQQIEHTNSTSSFNESNSSTKNTHLNSRRVSFR